MKILVTCPTMLAMKEHFLPIFESQGIEAICPEVVQTLSEDQLCDLVPKVDGWIIGDDPATAKVFRAGKAGYLKAAVKWGVGFDNVDFEACKQLAIPISNTPNMFGTEVADIALGYVIALARETFEIDRSIRAGKWPKNPGISLAERTVGVIGYGDIGSNTAARMKACGMNVITWDPGKTQINDDIAKLATWPHRISECDFLVVTCALNKQNHHMLDAEMLDACKDGVRIVNVARGSLIDEIALATSLRSGKVHSAALDVFEVEPLPDDSYFREHPLCILGSHNSSNTLDAVKKTNERAINLLLGYLKDI